MTNIANDGIGLNRFRAELFGLLVAIILFSVLRLPMVLHASGQMDEQWFAVPGFTVWNEGIPRIPYCPTRERATFFENADVCLFALPPALYYIEAPFFGLLPAGYPTARLPLFLAGIGSLVIVYSLARQLVSSAWVLTTALVLFAMSRSLMFTAITARPDLLCAVCGWCAILCMWRWHQSSRMRWLVLAGAISGLGMLCHPFAIVVCIQCGVWSLAKQGSLLERFTRAVVLTLFAVIVFSAWLPLILSYPKEFASQFGANVLERSGPGLTQRLLWPWPSLSHHWRYQLEFNLPYQFGLLIAGLVIGTIAWLLARRDHDHYIYLAITWSACYLTATVAGIHPTKGYWVYPIAMIIPLAVDGFAIGLEQVSRSITNVRTQAIAVRWVVMPTLSLLLVALMVPGAGLRTTATYLRHWGDPRFHAPMFIRGVLADMPRDGLFLADVNYIFDIYLSGRKTQLSHPRKLYWGDESPDYDYLMIGQEGIDFEAPRDYDARFDHRAGSRETDQHCFVDIYVPATTKRTND